MPSKTPDTATPTIDELPALTVVDPDSIPASGRTVPVTDTERTYIATLRDLLDNGSVVESGAFDDKTRCARSVQRVKRLLARIMPDYPGPNGEGMPRSIRFNVGARNGEFKWYARIGEPSKAGGRRKKGNDETAS